MYCDWTCWWYIPYHVLDEGFTLSRNTTSSVYSPSWFFILIWIELMWALDVYSLLTTFLAFMISLARILQDSVSPRLADAFSSFFVFSSSLCMAETSEAATELMHSQAYNKDDVVPTAQPTQDLNGSIYFFQIQSPLLFLGLNTLGPGWWPVSNLNKSDVHLQSQ